MQCTRFTGVRYDRETLEGERIVSFGEVLLRIGIEYCVVFSEYLRHFIGERRIEIDWRRLQSFVLYHLIDLEEEYLRTLDRERRNEQYSAAITRVFDRLAQSFFTALTAFVHAVTIYALHNDVIRSHGALSGIQEGLRCVAQVSGEHECATPARELHERGTQDMSCVKKFHSRIPYGKSFMVFVHLPQRNRGIDVFLCIERIALMQVLIERHNVQCIGKHDQCQIASGGSRDDDPAETIAHQLRNASDMIGVRMRHDKHIDRCRVVWEWQRVGRVAYITGMMLALQRSAID